MGLLLPLTSLEPEMSEEDEPEPWKMPAPALRGPMGKLREVTPRTKPSKVRKVAKELLEEIGERWEELSEKKEKGADARASGFLRKHVYQLGAHVLMNHQLEPLREFFPDEVRRRAGTPSLEENLFYWLFVDMFGRADDKMSLTVRNRMAKQLLYAWRHQIPPYLIVGFLAQMKDPQRINEKVANGEYEPWHPKYRKPSTADDSTGGNVDGGGSKGTTTIKASGTKKVEDEDSDQTALSGRILH